MAKMICPANAEFIKECPVLVVPKSSSWADHRDAILTFGH